MAIGLILNYSLYKNLIMIKTILGNLTFILLLAITFSCGDDCEMCSVASVRTENGSETSNTEIIAARDYCDDALDVIKASASTDTDTVGATIIVTENRVICNR